MSDSPQEQADSRLITPGYQSIQFSGGPSTVGRDRSAAAHRAFGPSLAGQSILDVGCAEGYFCFEAERLGASSVLGIDIKEDRLASARALAESMGSMVQFRLSPLEGLAASQETFDVVLALNVLHHLADPIRGLAILGGLTRQRLIIEVPTLRDPRFRRSALLPLASVLNRFPLMGVSEPGKFDQTFVFSPSALRRLCAAQLPQEFGRAHISRSRIRRRVWAVVTRASS